MRQLGKGQSVMFFAPGEVDRRIRSLIPRGKETENGVRVIDVVRWAIHETCWDISHHLPQWAQQGVDHHRRFSAYKKYDLAGNLENLRKSWLQPESKSLEEMYKPVSSKEQGTRLWADVKSIPPLRRRLKYLGITKLTGVMMAEVQEREVDHEKELEHHAEHPPDVFPAQHIIHEEIRNFVHTGILAKPSTYIIPLFSPTGIDEAVGSTAEWSPAPLATRDFAITTTDSDIMHLSDYLAPVNWVLSSGFGRDSTVIVISPYEANELLPIIRKSKKVRLHIYAARVTATMRSFSDLTFYTITGLDSPGKEWTAPAHLQTELNLFAGQLYFDSKEYEQVCVLLALYLVHPGAKHVEIDGFVPRDYRTGQNSPLTTSAIATLKKLTALRRKGADFRGTDLGRILDARP